MSIQSPAKCEIRSVIRYLVWKGKTPVEVYNEVKTVYGDKGMNRTSVFKWCREFKNGRTSVHDDQRSGRSSILTDDIVEEIENALRDDRRLTVDELSLGGKKFSTDEEVKGEVEKWTKGLAGNYFEEGIKKLIHRFTTCIERNGDYVEK
ncbi:GVQW3 protein, partial [Pseudoatta argentina]